MLYALLVCAFLSSAGAGADPSLDGVLARLAEHDARMEADYRPRLMTTRTEELDEEGQPMHTQVRVVRQRPGSAEPDQTELVRATDDGQDVTERVRGRAGRRNTSTSVSAQSPFGRAEQPRYRFTLLGADPRNAGWVRVGFAPREKNDGLLEGEAAVDAASGELVDFQARPVVLPRFADRVHLRVEFAPSEQGRRLSSVRVEGEGGFLFIHKRYRALMTFAVLPP